MRDIGNTSSSETITDLQKVVDLKVEAEGLEALYGPNLYSRFLRQHGHRPDTATAAAMGRILGGRVKASDGSFQPSQRSSNKSQRAQNCAISNVYELKPGIREKSK